MLRPGATQWLSLVENWNLNGHLSKPPDSVVKVGVRWPGEALGFRGLRSHGTGGRDLHNKKFSPLVDGKQPLRLEA